jgi:tetratricopeptide (TPR) repeat protein
VHAIRGHAFLIKKTLLQNIRERDGDRSPRPAFKVAADLLFIAVLLVLAGTAARSGFGKLLTVYAANAELRAAADAAVSISAGDADAHLIRGALCESANDLACAIAEYEKAKTLRPRDYLAWLNLARVRELNGEQNAAIDAANQATVLAPYYKQPRWQLGNLLIRAGRTQEGFRELSEAGRIDASMLPSIIDLAWSMSNGDDSSVIKLLNPQKAETFHALANFFRKKNRVESAVNMYGAAGAVAEQDRLSYIGELIQSQRYKQAYGLWRGDSDANSENYLATLIDPGFEQESNLDGVGFGWRSAQNPNVRLSLDSDEPREGRSSLKIEFAGDSNPDAAIISQIILVEPRTHYRLGFATRAEKIVSGGLPILFVKEAGPGRSLGQSNTLADKDNVWRDYSIDFTTNETSSAIQISLQRTHCDAPACPIFGRLWLDNFSLNKQ